MSTFRSRGYVHHADSTVTCPDCGRRFITPTHAVVGENLSQGFVGIQFKSKQADRQESGRSWGVIRVPVSAITWGRTHREAWDTAPPWKAAERDDR
jgi:hypothetical protein